MSRLSRFSYLFAVLSLCLLPHSASAFLIGVPSFSIAPNSQLGPIVFNSLTINPFPNGFSVSGQIHVNITTASAFGTLLSYQVDYPIDPTYPFNPTLFTTTAIDGFSLPPVGIAGNTAGYVDSSIVTLPNTILGPSAAAIPLSLVAGVDSPAWFPAIVSNSSVFPFAGGPGMVFRQTFTLDGIYSSGPGGLWIIDLPVYSYITSVPEPSSLLCLSTLSLLTLRRRSRTTR